MKNILLLLLFLSLSSEAFSQLFCVTPIPSRIAPIEEEISTARYLDSLNKVRHGLEYLQHSEKKFSYVNLSPQDSMYHQIVRLKKVQREMQNKPMVDIIDSAACYDLFLFEDRSWRYDPWGNSKSDYQISDTSLIISLFDFLKESIYVAYNVKTFFYGEEYLIVQYCFEYRGNSMYGHILNYYFRKEE